MIKLYGFGSSFGLPDASPFVLKVHTYLRMIGVEYENDQNMANLQSSPKGKLPFIDDGGQIIPDSAFIIEHLNAKHNIDLDQFLSEEEKGLAYLIGKSLDEDLYWCIVYSRWIREDTWPIAKKVWFDKMPFPLRHIIPLVARRGVKDKLQKQGLGRHSDQEILTIADKSLKSLSAVLGKKDFIMGDQVCSLDANVYGLLAQFILSDLDNDFTRMAKAYPNLVEYCNRMNQKYFVN
ncbi:glutathione S-transferase family protein [bacterium]|nr:glutathione S-transferase family protein [bacterium]